MGHKGAEGDKENSLLGVEQLDQLLSARRGLARAITRLRQRMSERP